MAVSACCFRSLIRSLRTKDPAIGALCPPARRLGHGRMVDEPSGSGRNSEGRGTGPLLWALTAASPDRGEDQQVPFSSGGAACPPDAASPDLTSQVAPGPITIGPGATVVPTAPVPDGAYGACGAENPKGPTLCVGPFTRAVAEGFEPSVSFPTLAFEASSFGRSDTLPRESLDHLGRPSKSDSRPCGQGVGNAGQRSRKKAVRRAAQSVSRTPWITSGRWLSRRSRTTSQREPAAPAFSSRAP